jgi:hypothetical protein
MASGFYATVAGLRRMQSGLARGSRTAGASRTMSVMKTPVKSLALAAAAALLLSGPAASQVDHDGALWEMWLGQGSFESLHPDWKNVRWWLDVQARWRDEGEDLDGTFLRPGLGYALTDRVTVFAGYALITTFPAGAPDRTENRLWQQLTWNVPVDGAYQLQFRSRLEQRFVEEADDTGWRFRQLAKYTRPASADGRRYLSLIDEVFYDLNDTDFGQDGGLSQNRAFVGLGWFLDEARTIAFEGGYLNQWISRPGDDRMNHALSLNLLVSF